MLTQLSPIQKGILWALAGYSGFAISDVSAKILTAHYPILLIVFFIAIFASAILLLVSPLLGGFKKIRPDTFKIHALRTFMNFGISILMVLSFAKLQLATIYSIIFAKPFIAALLAIPIYGEKIGPHRWLAIITGFSGVLIAMRPSPEGINFALLLPLGAAFCAALMWVVSRSLNGETAFSMGFYPIIGTALLTLPFVWPDFQIPALDHIPFFMICGAGASTGVIGLSFAFRSSPSAAVSPFHYSQMIWGLVFGYFIFSDIPDLWTLGGAAVIIASGLYLIRRESGSKKIDLEA